MPEAYIVDAVRTPVGKRGGALSGVHPADLGAHTIKALVDRTGIDPGAVDDVIFGCVDTIGPQAGDIARTAWLAAGLPEHVPGVTIDRQCGSSQQAVHFAAQGVMSGTQDLVVAGGVQNMSADPDLRGDARRPSSTASPTPFAESPGWHARYGDQEVSQFRSRRDDRREVGHLPRGDGGVRARAPRPGAARRIAEGRFDREIVAARTASTPTRARARPRLGEDGRARAAGAGRPDHRRGRLPDLRRLVRDADRVRAGGRSDHGLTPRARIHHLSVLGDDPVWMLTGPIPRHRARARRRPA